jgi:hypothetical protein
MGGSYLSASDRTLHFGLGAASRVEAITVAWPSGRVQQEAGSAANCLLTISER